MISQQGLCSMDVVVVFVLCLHQLIFSQLAGHDPSETYVG